MSRKLPYYMAYPLPFVYDDDKMERRDMEYMKSMYPNIPKKILPYVEEECDRSEYENSMIYDEYPDKLQLRMMCSRIYENVLKNEKLFYGTEYAEMLSAERRKEPMEQDLAMPSLGVGENWLRDMIEVMLYQELYRRRCDHRRCQRRFY
ncbi:hypothetical protein OCV51_12670 [Faecalicatena acetigenes]|uniref:Uncharacterized protein n=1 Tax=Faecalicatena acetigenes TaxID=2981790 RepID=A0ABT2TFB6_9FIRM|nr:MULTISPECIES: hypothetical protein [Lachnospiraceae]MCU6748497.1 hypothetical protein [Faecalicatena acetigenes]SCI47695.1 Uncharacterised protein [uncultured Clostridium sp.]